MVVIVVVVVVVVVIVVGSSNSISSPLRLPIVLHETAPGHLVTARSCTVNDVCKWTLLEIGFGERPRRGRSSG
jgi:hypothetical protein